MQVEGRRGRTDRTAAEHHRLSGQSVQQGQQVRPVPVPSGQSAKESVTNEREQGLCRR